MEDYSRQNAYMQVMLKEARKIFEATSLIVRGGMRPVDWRNGEPLFLLQNDVSGVKDYVDKRDPDAQDVKVKQFGSDINEYTQSFVISKDIMKKYPKSIDNIVSDGVIKLVNGWQRKFVELFMSTNAVGVDWDKNDDGLDRTVSWNHSSAHGFRVADNLDVTGLTYDQILEAYIRLTEFDSQHDKRYYPDGKYMLIMPNRLIPSLVSDPSTKYSETGKKFEEKVKTFENSITKMSLPFLENVEIFGLPLDYWKHNRLYKENVDGRGEGHYGIYCYLVYGGNNLYERSFGDEWLQGAASNAPVDTTGRQAFMFIPNYNNSMACKVVWHCGLGSDCIDKLFAVRIECRINNIPVV